MVIDIHCHVFYVRPASLPAFAQQLVRIGAGHGARRSVEAVVESMSGALRERAGEALIRDMDESGVDVSVLFAIDNIRLDDDAAMQRNRDVAALARRFSTRIVPFASIDPRREKAADMLRRCIDDLGARGLKLHPDHGYSLTSAESHRLLEVAHRHGLALITHTGPVTPPQRNRFAHPLDLDDVGCDFPGLKIIAAHAGGLWHRDWASIATFNNNMYGDLAEWQVRASANYDRFCGHLRDLLDIAPDRLLFASDWPSFEAYMPRKQWISLLRQLPDRATGARFTKEEIDGILGGNAARLLGV